MRHEKAMIDELAHALKTKGFRVFIAEKGTYGFFTDTEGTRVVSFGFDLGVLRFSGNYTTDNPRATGTGWFIREGWTMDFEGLFNAHPGWAFVSNTKWKFTPLGRFLELYQPSSRYFELSTVQGGLTWEQPAPTNPKA